MDKLMKGLFYLISSLITIFFIYNIKLPASLNIVGIFLLLIFVILEIISLIKKGTKSFLSRVTSFAFIYLTFILMFASLYELYKDGFQITASKEIVAINAQLRGFDIKTLEKAKIEYEKYNDAFMKAYTIAKAKNLNPGKPWQKYEMPEQVDYKEFYEWFDKLTEGIDRSLVDRYKKYLFLLDKEKMINRLDFFYFSLVTAATIGYGDIFPNSIETRRLVVIQILISLFLVLIYLNLIFSQIKEGEQS